jgi:trehalose-6-phosphate synthase
MHQSVLFEDLLALYAASDVCLITSIRDGMNLVSFEYVACQSQRRGVLLLSEFAGASERLEGSLLFNPWDKEGTSAALHRALTMDLDERTANHEKAEQFVMKNTRYGAHDIELPIIVAYADIKNAVHIGLERSSPS